MTERQSAIVRSVALGALAATLLSGGARTISSPIRGVTARVAPATHRSASFRKLPLRFEANAGQWDSRVAFVCRAGAATVALTNEGMAFSLRDAPIVTMKLVGAKPGKPIGAHAIVARSNFFLGSDPSRWRTDVPNFDEVRASDWLPGVDVVWHARPEGLEYDLVVRAGTDASKIAMDVDGAAALGVKSDGDLEIATSEGTLLEKPPRVVQRGRELRTRYRVEGSHRVAFDIDGYDRAASIFIDPAIVFATYLGGSSSDDAQAVALDSASNVYVAGWAGSNYPTTSGAYQATIGGQVRNAFVTKLDPTGSTLLYSTYLGGPAQTNATSIAVDASAHVYVTGNAGAGFPTTAGAYQTTYGGGSQDAFVSELDASGSALVYSTYLGGSNTDSGASVAVDSSGDAYVTGGSVGPFPTTAGAFDATYHAGSGTNVFVSKLNAAGSALAYSTLLHGTSNESGTGIAVDSSGDAYVSGWTSGGFPTTSGASQTTFGGNVDAFVTKVGPSGSALIYSTYLGGTNADRANAIALDSSGDAFVAGAAGAGFPTTAGVYQAALNINTHVFVTKLNASGSAPIYSTYVGSPGSSSDAAYGVALDSNGDAYLTGSCGSGFPVTLGAYQSSYAGGSDAFFTTLDPTGSALVYSSFLGGNAASGSGIAIDANENVYLVGATSGEFPTTANALQKSASGASAFVAEFCSLTIAPPLATVLAGKSATFTASGGAGGYAFSFGTNASGGSVGASTGLYTAGTKAGVVDVVQVADAAGHVAQARVTVPAVSITVTGSWSVPPKGTVYFGASGGSGTGYSWSIVTNDSGATIAANGVYTAGATPNVTDVVAVTDSFGNTATRAVFVGSGIAISPVSSSVPPGGKVAFAAIGGMFPFTWSIDSNQSGATLDQWGTYVAGPKANSVDTVIVTDALGNSASASVNVGASIAINPSSPTTPPHGALTFSVAGGSGTGFHWSLLLDGSGASIDLTTGAYKAGSKPSVTDIVGVTDSLGNNAGATVLVGAGISVTPPLANVAPLDTVAFAAAGGAGTGFTWSMSKNPSGGTIDGATGVYMAGSQSNTVDSISVVDPLGNTASAIIEVGNALTISPTTPTTPPLGTIAFAATGGSGVGLTWSLEKNASGGSIDSSTGAYVAGPTADVTDTVAARDSLGNAAHVDVVVTDGVSIAPGDTSVASGGLVGFNATGGSGTGYAWSLAVNESGGDITKDGLYTAGPKSGVDTVRVVDAVGSFATASVHVLGPSDVGCSCRASRSESSSAGSFSVVLLALAIARRRRSSERSRPRDVTRSR
ncbi:MAG TPA: SBBP repeat-containing protein [Polyangiaceae bacterium]|jgi:hypothetical protein